MSQENEEENPCGRRAACYSSFEESISTKQFPKRRMEMETERENKEGERKTERENLSSLRTPRKFLIVSLSHETR